MPHPLLAGSGTVAAAEGDPAAPDCLAAPPIVFVDVCATGRNTGMNWTDAFADLQDALNLAACSVAVREIWVAAGTYRPSRRVHPTDVQSATFQLLSGLAIYGGFDGSETEREERNPERNTTILSGDLEERDNSGRGNAMRAYHVVIASGTDSSTVLDGVVIEGGKAEGDRVDDNVGGGMLCIDGSPAVVNCTFRNNEAEGGGAMYNERSAPTLISCSIQGNEARFGAGVANVQSNPTLVNCLFVGNNAAETPNSAGGAMENRDGSAPTLINCTLGGNTAVVGGAIFNADSHPVVTNCILWQNLDAGGMNEAAQLHDEPGSMTQVNHSCIQGLTGTLGGVGNIGADPLFRDADGLDGTFGTGDDDVRVSSVSPCVDAGDNAALPFDTLDLDDDGDQFEPLPLDFSGSGRVTAGVVDMGSHEFAPNRGESLRRPMTFNDPTDFIERLRTNNDNDRVFVERLSCNDPDPRGMGRWQTLVDPKTGDIDSARAKIPFAGTESDRLIIQIEYVFRTASGELAVYLSNGPSLGTGNTLVGIVRPPLPGQPGSPESGEFAVFRRSIDRGSLDIRRAVYIELELRASPAGFQANVGGLGAATPDDPISPLLLAGVADIGDVAIAQCRTGVCYDLNGNSFLDPGDFQQYLVTNYGRATACVGSSAACDLASVCDELPFSRDGSIDLGDLLALDLLLLLESRNELPSDCTNAPLAVSAVVPAGDPIDVSTSVVAGTGTTLLVSGKRLALGSTECVANLPCCLQDRLFALDRFGQPQPNDAGRFIDVPPSGVNVANGRLIQDRSGSVYQLHSERGLIAYPSGAVIVPPARVANGPDGSKVMIGLMGRNPATGGLSGRPILDAAFDSSAGVYVAPVIVTPLDREPYVAAAKLELRPGQVPPFAVVQVYPRPSDPPPSTAIREIEVDESGNLYVLASDLVGGDGVIHVYQTVTGLRLRDLALAIAAPIGLCVSRDAADLYLASALTESPTIQSTTVFRLAADTGIIRQAIRVEPDATGVGMGHVTGITEDSTGGILVVGFGLRPNVPSCVSDACPCDLATEPYVAAITPLGNGSMPTSVTVRRIDAAGLALPTSAVWISGSRVLSVWPTPDAVINRTPGVQQIVVQYDRPVSVSAIQVTGVSTGEVPGGVLIRNGTDRHTLNFSTPLPDRDRYTVVVNADSVVTQWTFVTLVGDCNLDQRVNIFDLAMMRDLIRNGLYDAQCDIQEDGQINIFDLGHLRRALRDDSMAK